MIITIDGPSGTGKSTVAKLVAKRLGCTYFDTGAMYRSLSYVLLKKGLTQNDHKEIEAILDTFLFEIRKEEDGERYFANGEDVSKPIRGQEVTKFVSEVAALPFVRKRLVEIQRRFAENTHAVFEGRDLGTVVFPQADQKIFLTADARVRAERRYLELLQKNPSLKDSLSLEEIERDINERDDRDSTRKASPLRKAEGAYEVDTSHLSIDQVVEEIVSIIPQASELGEYTERT